MPQSTTTTITSTIASEILSQRALASLTPKLVALPRINRVNIDGSGSLTYKLPVESLMADAASVSEGSDASSISDFSYGSAISLTPTERYARGDLTARAIRRGSGGMLSNQVFDAMQDNNVGSLLPMLEPYAMRAMERLYALMEKDTCAGFANASVSVGTSTNDLTIANLVAARYSYYAASPSNENVEWFLTPIQVSDLITALAAGSGSSLANIFVQSATTDIVNWKNDGVRDGLMGSFMGIPLRQIDALSKATANVGADDVGALMAVGVGDPAFGQRGAQVIVEGFAPRIVFDVDMSARNVEIIALGEWIVGEHTDAHYIKIVTDAP